ncbi:MAG: hypothetical protein KDE59_26380 [Anaerolineales bacterium]|nr:hypothetical protein [Anaerolineales bacterium]MCB0011688.1 hypothetical protein [Anaerolineales bacterium]
MPDFPCIMLDQHFATQAELLADLARRGEYLVTEHPGQFSPAEPLQKCPPGDKRIIGAAATILIATASHPNLLMFLSEIGPWAGTAWQQALLDRLVQGPPLPRVSSYATGPVSEHLTATLARPNLPDDVRQRARQVLEQRGPAGGLVQFLILYGRPAELARAIAAYVAEGNASPPLVRYAVSRLAAQDAIQLLVLLPALRDLAQADREAIVAKLTVQMPETWLQAHRDRIRYDLDLDATS